MELIVERGVLLIGQSKLFFSAQETVSGASRHPRIIGRHGGVRFFDQFVFADQNPACHEIFPFYLPERCTSKLSTALLLGLVHSVERVHGMGASSLGREK